MCMAVPARSRYAWLFQQDPVMLYDKINRAIHSLPDDVSMRKRGKLAEDEAKDNG